MNINNMNNDGWNIKPNGWGKINNLNYDIHIKKSNVNKFLNNIDGIFVLAGGIESDGKCHPFVIDRLIIAYNIYKQINKPIFCIGGGSYHTPPILNSAHYIIHESTSCAEFLIKYGVFSKHIYKEYASYDTIANGYYSFTNFIIPLKLSRISLITSDFHMERSKTIFNWMKQLFNYEISIEFISATNNNLDKKILLARQNREYNSNNNLKNNIIPKYNNLQLFHKWFYTEHKAYCANSELNRNTVITDKLLKKSY